ncbi:RsmB/NOP family class I SAM-dependent RNA methyltransferase [Labrys wisconsinensis]|uniref:16S rRNA (Cytosine967-C5)-methyltransferase n=1 Tax=Labrys wisconsinensis TaxID=425677 RepID=A0ABU0J2E9_9HYPH|nr:RsmB/NOP family class I SAM-dependent RNA methyltransferase [Labrys wisconsinensis]MDQ0468432.1 16S rRNA (cytosine967-C5)-methyltransferase [Labrys wisconsinensis]
MTPAARLSAAIEVLADIDARRRPAADVLKDWGLAHRFAGSGDRAAIASLAYDVLRRRASARWLLDAETPRAGVIGMLALQRRLDADAIAALFSGERFAPEPLTAAEREALVTRHLEEAPPAVQADVPDWLWPAFAGAFGAEAIAEGQGLAERAPLDLRVNTLKTSRDKAVAELSPLGAAETVLSPWGLRVPLGADGRGPSVQVEPSFLKGWFEVQDEGSQIAALIARAEPGEQVLDLCAGAGGKTLELAATMANKGQIYATDSDKRRLAPIHDRLERAGARNVQVRTPRGGPPELGDLAGRMDLVLIDAPCSGSGTWRRNPDAKWRMRPNSLADRIKDQAGVLRQGAAAVKPGGRLVYITCSVLPEENDGAVEAFLRGQDGFSAATPAEALAAAGFAGLGRHASPRGLGVQLTPRRTATDGFYVAVLRRGGDA